MGKDELMGRTATALMVLALMVMWIGGWAVLNWLMPQHYFRMYSLIPITFIVIAIVSMLLLLKWKKNVASGRTTQQRMTINLLAAKMSKFLLAIILILLYWKLCGDHTREFLVIFAIYYAVYLVMETLVFTKFVNRPETQK